MMKASMYAEYMPTPAYLPPLSEITCVKCQCAHTDHSYNTYIACWVLRSYMRGWGGGTGGRSPGVKASSSGRRRWESWISPYMKKCKEEWKEGEEDETKEDDDKGR